MDVSVVNIFKEKIKASLVFFCVFLVLGCSERAKITNLNVDYHSGKAISLSFFANAKHSDFKIFVVGNSEIAVLGTFTKINNRHVFTPAIPFSKGQGYDLYYDNRKVSNFIIEAVDNVVKPVIETIYPSADTIPENALKFYIEFSKPMQEVGHALDFIRIYNESDDREEAVFLDMEAELWNADHTRLTLWLDPGRIKTDLIPNREKGLPILKGKMYTLHIDQRWRDAEGTILAKNYTKTFFVGERDQNKPLPANWELKIPKKSTMGALSINFKEPMDAILALECMNIMNDENKQILGDFRLTSQERQLIFKPITLWKPGNYTLEIESRLEDLAGNNLNHLFDRDLNQLTNKEEQSETKSISFKIP